MMSAPVRKLLTSSLCVGCLLLLNSCAYQFLDDDDPHGPHHTDNVTPDPHAPMQPPLTFVCDGGERFVIAFSQTADSAVLKLPNGAAPEVLKEDPIGSGVEYANRDYDFREHKGRVVLTALGPPEAAQTCHKIKQS